jgi:hypothetical protein
MCEASANEGRRQYNEYGDDPEERQRSRWDPQ